MSQVGYWNEDEKYVTTASFVRGSNETYGLQNRTYIVTTILVSKIETLRDYGEDGAGKMAQSQTEKGMVTFFIFFNDRVPKGSCP